MKIEEELKLEGQSKYDDEAMEEFGKMQITNLKYLLELY
jgi:hypothetical protein